MSILERGEKQQLNVVLKEFKTQTGAPDFPKLLAIPSNERIANWAKHDYEKIFSVLTAGLTIAFENMNLSRPMKSGQIVELSDAIIDESNSDNLSLEDVFLFVQKLTRGEYGVMYESMDIPKFMEKFDIFRQERHNAVVAHREAEDARLNSFGNPTDRAKASTLFDEQMASYVARVQEKNDEIKLLRREAREK